MAQTLLSVLLMLAKTALNATRHQNRISLSNTSDGNAVTDDVKTFPTNPQR